MMPRIIARPSARPREKVVLVGGGGHASVVLDVLLQHEGELEVVGVLDPDPARAGTVLWGIPVLGGDELLGGLRARGVSAAIAAVGDNGVRSRLFERILESGLSPLSAIHPRAIVSPRASVGRGVAVMAGAVVNGAASIGDDVIVNTGATIDHHCVVEAHAHVAPRVALAGNVSIGRGALVGIGASVLPGIRVGHAAVVGAGAVVTEDVPDGVTVVGVPARARSVAG